MARMAAAYPDPDPAEWYLELVSQARHLAERVTEDPAGTREALLAGAEQQQRRQLLPITDDMTRSWRRAASATDRRARCAKRTDTTSAVRARPRPTNGLSHIHLDLIPVWSPDRVD